MFSFEMDSNKFVLKRLCDDVNKCKMLWKISNRDIFSESHRADSLEAFND